MVTIAYHWNKPLLIKRRGETHNIRHATCLGSDPMFSLSPSNGARLFSYGSWCDNTRVNGIGGTTAPCYTIRPPLGAPPGPYILRGQCGCWLSLGVMDRSNCILNKAIRPPKKTLCFRDFADYLFWNLKDFFYSEILKTPPFFPFFF